MRGPDTRPFTPKTVPSEGKPTRAVSNGPDVPSVERVPLHGLEQRIYGARTTVNGTTNVEPASDWYVVGGQRKTVEGVAIIPTTPIPLLPHQEVSIGGTRTIGGGTSKDALRRAKRNARAGK